MTPPEVAEEFRNAGSADRKRKLVLTVEDEHEDWLMYGKLLWYNGFEVLHAETGEEGLAMAREHHPDIILADLMLPGMDGIDMCRTLRREATTREIPLVMLTARTEREFGSRARQAGCDVFLEKPVGPLAVLHVIEDLVGRPPPPVD